MMHHMRTTVTFDEDVARQIEKRMREQGVPFKRLVNDLLRRGLRADPGDTTYRCPTFSAEIRPGLDLTKALALASALDDDELLRKVELGK